MPNETDEIKILTSNDFDDDGNVIVADKEEVTAEKADNGGEDFIAADDKQTEKAKTDEKEKVDEKGDLDKKEPKIEFSDDNLDPDIEVEEKKDDALDADTPKYTLNELFGEGIFKTPEEIKSANIPTILKEHSTLKEKVQKHNQIIEKYKEKIKQLANPFASDDVKKLNTVIKSTGISNPYVANRIMNIDTEKMDAKDVIVLAELIKNPDLASKRDKIENRINRKYHLGDSRPFTEIEDEDTGNMVKKYHDDQDALDEMELDAETAKKEINDIKEKIKDDDIDIEELLKVDDVDTSELKKVWEPIIPDILSKIVEIPIQLSPNSEPIGFYKINREWLDSQKEKLLEMAISDNLLFDEKNITKSVEKVYHTVVNRFYAEHQMKINQAIWNNATKKALATIKQKAKNPSGGTSTETRYITSNNDSKVKVMSADQAADEAMEY